MRISDWSSDVCSSDLDGSGGVISVKKTGNIRAAVISTAAILLLASPAAAHKLRVSGEAVAVADSGVTVTPGRDWNRLDAKAGKNTETWTLEGDQLNEDTFFGGKEGGKPQGKRSEARRGRNRGGSQRGYR